MTASSHRRRRLCRPPARARSAPRCPPLAILLEVLLLPSAASPLPPTPLPPPPPPSGAAPKYCNLTVAVHSPPRRRLFLSDDDDDDDATPPRQRQQSPLSAPTLHRRSLRRVPSDLSKALGDVRTADDFVVCLVASDGGTITGTFEAAAYGRRDDYLYDEAVSDDSLDPGDGEEKDWARRPLLSLDGSRGHNHPLGGRIIWVGVGDDNNSDEDGSSSDSKSGIVIDGGTSLDNWTRCPDVVPSSDNGRERGSMICPTDDPGWEEVWVHDATPMDLPPIRQLWVELDYDEGAKASGPDEESSGDDASGVGGDSVYNLDIGERRKERRRQRSVLDPPSGDEGSSSPPRRFPRTSLPGGAFDFLRAPTGYVTSSPLLSAAWSTSEGGAVELVWTGQIRNWIEARCPVSSVQQLTERQWHVTPSSECWRDLLSRYGTADATDPTKLPPPPEYVENVLTIPPERGTFLSTSGSVYYRPPPDRPYSSPLRAVTPKYEILFEGRHLINRTFYGLNFIHGGWFDPGEDGGYVPTQSGVTSRSEPRGAVRVSSSSGIDFVNCSFSRMGSAYALEVGDASRDVNVTHCAFDDLSGGAIKLGNVDDGRAISPIPSSQDSHLAVERCAIHNAALEYSGMAAIFAGYVRDTAIGNNTIQNVGYTAISLGWGWGSHTEGKPQTWAADNAVRYNRMIGIMSALTDGGCVYTLGPQPRTFIKGNYCSSDRSKVVGCYYLDNGSRGITVVNNVADASPGTPCAYLQGCCGAPAGNSTVRKLWCRRTGPVRNGCKEMNCAVDEGSVVTVEEGEEWPAEARRIVDGAGA